jgi:hypothetical protein
MTERTSGPSVFYSMLIIAGAKMLLPALTA